jgi:hypothetical protein
MTVGEVLRSADDFDSYYQSPDPWKIGRASRRDRALSRIIAPHAAGKTVLELGCGEGHLTSTIFKGASRTVLKTYRLLGKSAITQRWQRPASSVSSDQDGFGHGTREIDRTFTSPARTSSTIGNSRAVNVSNTHPAFPIVCGN